MSRLGTVLRRTGIICALVGWFSNTVAADPIRSSWRFVGATLAAETPEGSFGIFTPAESTELPGLFNSWLRDATPPPEFGFPTTASYSVAQHSDVSATGWSGSGIAATGALEGDPSLWGAASAETIMEVAFSLLEPMSYRLAGTISGDGGFAAIRLDGPRGLGWLFESGDAVPMVAMRRGLLSPGEYVFAARAYSQSTTGEPNPRGFGLSAFNVQFTLTDPVPEPATLLLFGTGAAFVGRTAWRRRREQSATGSSDPVGGTQGDT